LYGTFQPPFPSVSSLVHILLQSYYQSYVRQAYPQSGFRCWLERVLELSTYPLRLHILRCHSSQPRSTLPSRGKEPKESRYPIGTLIPLMAGHAFIGGLSIARFWTYEPTYCPMVWVNSQTYLPSVPVTRGLFPTRFCVLLTSQPRSGEMIVPRLFHLSLYHPARRRPRLYVFM
jgi:hypothetical protein